MTESGYTLKRQERTSRHRLIAAAIAIMTASLGVAAWILFAPATGEANPNGLNPEPLSLTATLLIAGGTVSVLVIGGTIGAFIFQKKLTKQRLRQMHKGHGSPDPSNSGRNEQN